MDWLGKGLLHFGILILLETCCCLTSWYSKSETCNAVIKLGCLILNIDLGFPFVVFILIYKYLGCSAVFPKFYWLYLHCVSLADLFHDNSLSTKKHSPLDISRLLSVFSIHILDSISVEDLSTHLFAGIWDANGKFIRDFVFLHPSLPLC